MSTFQDYRNKMERKIRENLDKFNPFVFINNIVMCATSILFLLYLKDFEHEDYLFSEEIFEKFLHSMNNDLIIEFRNGDVEEISRFKFKKELENHDIINFADYFLYLEYNFVSRIYTKNCDPIQSEMLAYNPFDELSDLENKYTHLEMSILENLDEFDLSNFVHNYIEHIDDEKFIENLDDYDIYEILTSEELFKRYYDLMQEKEDEPLVFILSKEVSIPSTYRTFVEDLIDFREIETFLELYDLLSKEGIESITLEPSGKVFDFNEVYTKSIV